MNLDSDEGSPNPEAEGGGDKATGLGCGPLVIRPSSRSISEGRETLALSAEGGSEGGGSSERRHGSAGKEFE